jgi:hypothetical protein
MIGFAAVAFSGSYNDLMDVPDDIATEEYVSKKIAESQLEGAEVDLSAYYTKSETEAKIEEALAPLEAEIHDKPNDGDLEDVRMSAIINAVAIVENKNYATTAYVDESIRQAELSGNNVDLSNYYTKDEVIALGYQTEAQVIALIQANLPANAEEVEY